MLDDGPRERRAIFAHRLNPPPRKPASGQVLAREGVASVPTHAWKSCLRSLTSRLAGEDDRNCLVMVEYNLLRRTGTVEDDPCRGVANKRRQR